MVAVVVRAALEAAGVLVAGVWPGEVEDDGVMGVDLAVVEPELVLAVVEVRYQKAPSRRL